MRKETGSHRKHCRVQELSGQKQWQPQEHCCSHAWASPVPYPYTVSFVLPDPCASKLNTGLAVGSNSNHPNITFYLEKHPNLHCLTLPFQWPCEVDGIITLLLQRRKPEVTEMQSRARIWTGSFDFKLELLWFEHHHCEDLPFAWKNTNIWGQLSRRACLGKGLVFSYLLSFPCPFFISVPYLGPCSSQMKFIFYPFLF